MSWVLVGDGIFSHSIDPSWKTINTTTIAYIKPTAKLVQTLKKSMWHLSNGQHQLKGRKSFKKNSARAWTWPIFIWGFSIAWCQAHPTSAKPLLSWFILPTFWYEWLMSFTPWWTVVKHIAVLLYLLNFVAWKRKCWTLSSQWA